MNIFDVIIILFIAMSAVVGFKKGIIKETVSFVGLIVIFVIAFIFKEQLGNILCKFLPFFKFTGSLKGLVSINILIYQMIAFLLIYGILSSIYMIVLKLSGILQKLVNLTIILLLPSKAAGAVIGALEGYLVAFIVILVIMIPFKDVSIISESNLTEKILYETPILSKSTESITKSVKEVYTLADKVSKNKLSTNDANVKIIDAMLKYKVVSKKTIDQLIVLDKLNDVKGLDKVLKNYK